MRQTSTSHSRHERRAVPHAKRVRWHARRAARRAGLAVALLTLALSGCASYVNGYRAVSLPDVPKQTETVAPTQREHQRILATYGGVYNDPRLEGLITRVVEQLVATSERPELKYRVTILNSPSVNAFALPNGQLYVTRGLLALSSDRALRKSPSVSTCPCTNWR